MPCKDCQCSRSSDQTLSDATSALDLTDKTEQQCECGSCNSRSLPVTSGCSCCDPSSRRRNCRCCPCRSCCSCCSCSSSGRGVCAGLNQETAGGCTSCSAKKEEPKPKIVEEVTDNCKCCEAKQQVGTHKKVCAGCGCDKCT